MHDFKHLLYTQNSVSEAQIFFFLTGTQKIFLTCLVCPTAHSGFRHQNQTNKQRMEGREGGRKDERKEERDKEFPPSCSLVHFVFCISADGNTLFLGDRGQQHDTSSLSYLFFSLKSNHLPRPAGLSFNYFYIHTLLSVPFMTAFFLTSFVKYYKNISDGLPADSHHLFKTVIVPPKHKYGHVAPHPFLHRIFPLVHHLLQVNSSFLDVTKIPLSRSSCFCFLFSFLLSSFSLSLFSFLLSFTSIFPSLFHFYLSFSLSLFL